MAITYDKQNEKMASRDKLIANLNTDLSKQNLELTTLKTDNENRQKQEKKDKNNSSNLNND